MSPFKIFKHNWKFFITICSPIILTTIPVLWQSETGGKEPYAAYVIILMSLYWMTECIPLSVTAFIPIILYPLFGILSTDKVTSAYLQDGILFLFGGCICALSFECSNLHTRLALRVILLVGAKIPQLLFGMMMTTMFLSMWMNNTSTTAMMVPIVHAIVAELQKEMEKSSQGEEDVQLEVLRGSESTASFAINREKDAECETTEMRQEKIVKQVRNLRIMFLLGTAWASNIGGTGIITGSSSNVISLDLIRKDADESSPACKDVLKVSFLDWMIFNVPPMILNTILTWAYLQLHFLGFPNSFRFWKKKYSPPPSSSISSENAMARRVEKTMRSKYTELGPLNAHEIGVLILFVVIVLLWLFKDPQIIPGWDSLPIFQQGDHGKSYIKEATPTFLVAVLLCVIPSKTVYYALAFSGGLSRGLKDPLLSWDFIYRKFPWGLFMLLGGGTGMAVGAKASGLNKWIGMQLESSSILRECPNWLLLMIILVLVTVLTTIASNTACAAIVTPVLLGIAYAKDIHPLFLVLGGATVCSYAFALPVSTPPNAIAYSSTNDIKLLDMAFPGVVVNVICILVLMLTTHTSSNWYFSYANYSNACARI